MSQTALLLGWMTDLPALHTGTPDPARTHPNSHNLVILLMLVQIIIFDYLFICKESSRFQIVQI